MQAFAAAQCAACRVRHFKLLGLVLKCFVCPAACRLPVAAESMPVAAESMRELLMELQIS